MFPHYVEAHKAAEEGWGCAGCGAGGGGLLRQTVEQREGETLELRWSVSHSLFLFPFPFIHANKQLHTQTLDTYTHRHKHTCVLLRPPVTTF